MSRTATIEEVKEFANKVRQAGGANPLDALMPAIPEDPSACLIARNLNFSCQVDGAHIDDWEEVEHPEVENWVNYGSDDRWQMTVDDPKIAKRIGEKLNLPYIDDSLYGRVLLPVEIGNVALAFDSAIEEDDPTASQFWPYIEETEKIRRAEVNSNVYINMKQQGQDVFWDGLDPLEDKEGNILDPETLEVIPDVEESELAYA